MTVNSLVNFGVPGIDGRAPPLQPIPANKFRVTLRNFGGQDTPYILTQQVRSVELPKLRFQMKPTDTGDYVVEKADWDYTPVKFLDEVSGDLFKAIVLQGHIQKTKGALFEMDIDLLSDGNVIRRYSHGNCEITSVDPVGKLDYSSSEGIEFTMWVKYFSVETLVPTADGEEFKPLYE
jgi:hypothetical protein